MPRPPRIRGGGGGRFGIPGGGGGRHGIGGGPYKRVDPLGMDPRGLIGKRQGYDRFSGKSWVIVDKHGIPVSEPGRGGALPRKPRPPITQQTGPSPRERVARKIASKIMEREKFTWFGLSSMDQSEAQQAVLDAAKKAVLTTYEEAGHYPSGRDATPEQDRKDKEIYGRAYRNAKTAAQTAAHAEWFRRFGFNASSSPASKFILRDWSS